MPEPCDADWDAMSATADGRSRFCAHCRRDLIDLTKLDEREAIELFEAVANGAEEPCINVARRRDGTIVFADTPDVPASALVRKLVQSAAVFALAAACAPTPRPSSCPEGEWDSETRHCFADDHVDGEILSPEGANLMARGRARPGPMFRSREMDRKMVHDEHHEVHVPEDEPPPEPAPVAVDPVAAADALLDELVHALKRQLPDFDRAQHVFVRQEDIGFSIRFERDVSYVPPKNCPPNAKCSMQRRFDSKRAAVANIECYTGEWMGTAMVIPVDVGELRLKIDIDGAKPGTSSSLRKAIDEVIARHRPR